VFFDGGIIVFSFFSFDEMIKLSKSRELAFDDNGEDK